MAHASNSGHASLGSPPRHRKAHGRQGASVVSPVAISYRALPRPWAEAGARAQSNCLSSRISIDQRSSWKSTSNFRREILPKCLNKLGNKKSSWSWEIEAGSLTTLNVQLAHKRFIGNIVSRRELAIALCLRCTPGVRKCRARRGNLSAHEKREDVGLEQSPQVP